MIWRKWVTENPPSLRQTLDQNHRRQPSARACVRREAASFKSASRTQSVAAPNLQKQTFTHG